MTISGRLQYQNIIYMYLSSVFNGCGDVWTGVVIQKRVVQGANDSCGVPSLIAGHSIRGV